MTKRDSAAGEHTSNKRKKKDAALSLEKPHTHTALSDQVNITDNVDGSLDLVDSVSAKEHKLTPEEIAAKEKKRRKKQEKKRKKQEKLSGETVEEDTQDKDSATKALDYLNQWKDDRDQWSFQKVRQVWLLQHMYDVHKVSDSNFTTLLEYLEGLKGKGRELTVKKAETIMTVEEKDGETQSPSDTDMDILQQKMDRAKQVLQLLS